MTIRALRHRPSRQRGYSLAEIMVVMAIFTVIIVAALVIYDRSNKVFKESIEASDMQQSTRVAFDKLVADVRLAGFDYDRDGIPFGSLSANWAAKTNYVTGNIVQPVPSNGHVYICTTGGISSAAAPAWPTTKNATVNDGTVTWQEKETVQYQQPDEQIEYAGDKAITIRANFNFETATGTCPNAGSPCKSCENGRETCLEDQVAGFPLVTTNNQEIVTYALVSTSGNASANKDAIVFYADVDIPRDVNPKGGKKETGVKITGVDLTNKYPPYTLYRYTLKDDGTPDAGIAVADNIRSMTFRYFTDTAASDIADASGKTHEIGCGDAAKCEEAALPFGEGQYDPGSPDTDILERDSRAKIKAIRLSLVGMNPQIDAAYTDTDADAPHYRKLQLDTVIVPRNLGKHGMKEFNTTLPEPPTLKSVCIGACEATYLTWTAPPSGGDVDSYNIVYNPGDCSASPLTYATAEDAGKNLSGFASKTTPGVQYRFAVQSVNKYGSATSSCVAGLSVATPINKTTPTVPASLSATGGADATLVAQKNAVQLYWPPVTTNVAAKSTMSCTDGSSQSAATIPAAERIYYRVYRSTSSGFNPPGAGTMIINESSANQPSLSGSNLTVTDPTAANCLSYYYKIEAVNACATNDALNNPSNKSLAESGYIAASTLGKGFTTQTPAAPSGLSVRNTNCGGSLCDVTFGWLATSTDSTGAAMNVSQYQLYVTDLSKSPATAIPGSPFTTTTTSFQVQNIDPGNVSGYKVEVAALDCNPGAKSAPIIWPCVWDGGTITVAPSTSFGGSGTSGNPWVMQTPDSLTVTTQNAIKQIDWTLTQNNVVVAQGSDVGPKTSFTVGLPDLVEDTSTRVRIALTSASGTCAITQSYFVIDQSAPACSLTDQQTDTNVVKATFKNITVTLKNTSTSVLKPKKVIVKWNPNYANNASLNSLTYPSSSGTSTLTTNCSTSTVVFDISSDASSIAASQTNYGPLTLAFTHNTSLTGSNATMTNGSICIVYQSPTGDLLSCQIFPNATTCTNLSGSACQ